MKQSIILTVAPPGAGKTTWAEKVASKKGFVNLNRDDLRKFHYPEQYKNHSLNKTQENKVTNEQKRLATEALKAGKTIIVSDTNINPETRQVWKDIASGYGVKYFEKHFRIENYLQTCLERNALRKVGRVPDHVIRKFYADYRAQYMKPYDPAVEVPGAYLFDIDGTLALNTSGRSPYDWDRVGEDVPNVDVVRVCRRLGKVTKIVVMSGRDACCYNITKEWLLTHGIPFDSLIMRPAGNTEPDWIVKYDLFKKHVEPNYEVFGIYDDRNQVVDMWRKIGLTCFQVAEGNF